MTEIYSGSAERDEHTQDFIKNRAKAVILKFLFFWTVLYVAVKFCADSKSVGMKAGVDINGRDSSGATALLWSAFHGLSSLAAALLKRPNVDVNLATWSGGMTPLVAALLPPHSSGPLDEVWVKTYLRLIRAHFHKPRGGLNSQATGD